MNHEEEEEEKTAKRSHWQGKHFSLKFSIKIRIVKACFAAVATVATAAAAADKRNKKG